jgi:four helix bundle protein
MAGIKSFRDLDVYKLALAEAKKIFVITKSFPKEEIYAMSGQVRRSSRAVGAMIAESWARRSTRQHLSTNSMKHWAKLMKRMRG